MRIHEAILAWFLPADLDGEDPRARQATRTVKIALAMLLWVPVFVVVYEYVKAPISAAILAFAGSVLLLALRSLRWGVRVPIVANVVIGLVCLTLVALSAVTGGLGAPASRWQAVVPLLGILLGGRKCGLIWTAVSLGCGAAFVLLRIRIGPLPSELTDETLALVSTCGDLGMISCVAIVTALFDKSERAAQSMLLAARYAAEAATRAKSSFLANMSHELRTPMNGILGMTELTLKTELTGVQQDYLRIVKSSAGSLLRIVDDILDFSKIEAGRLTLDETEFEIADCIDEAIEMVASQACAKGLTISCTVDRRIPSRICGDPFRLRQVLLNLLCNAVKFTDHGGISITAESTPLRDGQVGILFRVTDTGSGIPSDKLDAIFEAFIQADTSTTRTHGGTGLGLAICVELVELMGGRLHVSSELGAGSCFEFTAWFRRTAGNGLSDVQQPDNSALITRSPPVIAPPACGSERSRDCSSVIDVRPRGFRVLVAEDNLINQRLAEIVLTQAGHDVVLASNGAEAIARSSDAAIDLILMDLNMPRVDGLEATRAIRRQEAGTGRRLPIIALTANALQEDRDQCLAAGMDGFLVKPLEPGALNQAIARHCSAPAAHA